MFHFYTTSKRQKTSDFPTFLGSIEIVNLRKMGSERVDFSPISD